MTMTWCFPLFPFVFFGCTQDSGADSDTWLGVQADAKAAPEFESAPLLPVRYDGEEAEVVIQVTRSVPDGMDQVVAWGEVVEGSALLALPLQVPLPPEGTAPEALYRVVARRMNEDGRPGAFLDVARDAVELVPTGDGSAHWYVVVPREDDKPLYAPLRRGVEVADALRPQRAAAVEGRVSEAIGTSRYGLALLTDADAIVPAFINESMDTEGAAFSVGVQGPPPAATLRGEQGPTSGRYWPVAWSDADGEAGFDPAEDDLLGLTCAAGGVFSFVWQASPRTIEEATRLADLGRTVGWSTRIETANGLQDVPDGVVPWLSAECI